VDGQLTESSFYHPYFFDVEIELQFLNPNPKKTHYFEAPSAVAVKTLLQPMSAYLFKRNVRSPSADVYAKIPSEKRTRDHTESEYSERRDEALGRPCAMVAEIATKMDCDCINWII